MLLSRKQQRGQIARTGHSSLVSQVRDNNTLHTEPRAARVFLLASLSPRPGER